jgi:glycosyltransferase involved in cell wall biosynthesis
MSTRLPTETLQCADFAALCGRAAAGGRALLVALPEPFTGVDAARLMGLPGVAGVIWPARDQVPPDAPSERSGWLVEQAYDWVLPRQGGDRLLFLGPRRRLTARMLRSAYKAGIRRITYAQPLGWRSVSVLRLVAERVRERSSHAVARRLRPALAMFGRRLEPDFAAFVKAARERNAGQPSHAVPGRILHANHSLSLGGTERQIVNTLIGLRDRGFDDLTLLCERRHDHGRMDSFGRRLLERQIAIEELPTVPSATPLPGLLDRIEALRPALDRWPSLVADDMVFFAEALLRSRPFVMHAWQDVTNVRAGLAAVLAGVPRILLSMRNISPVNFANWYPWLRPAYRALAGHPDVVFVNNSEAGAHDYAGWLDLPVQRINVVHNGLAPEAFARVGHAAVAAFRERHGIGPGVRVVGSVFRFWPEKNPKLWIRVAAEIARQRPDVRFMLVGYGPLLPLMQRQAQRLGIANQVIFAGEEADPRAALAAMDAFLLVSRGEGLPNVLIEAQAQGVPVVTTAVGGAPEAVDPGRTGLIVPDSRPAELAKAVLQVLDDAGWAEAARRAAPQFAAARFGLAPMIDETLRLYGLRQPR